MFYVFNSGTHELAYHDESQEAAQEFVAQHATPKLLFVVPVAQLTAPVQQMRQTLKQAFSTDLLPWLRALMTNPVAITLPDEELLEMLYEQAGVGQEPYLAELRRQVRRTRVPHPTLERVELDLETGQEIPPAAAQAG